MDKAVYIVLHQFVFRNTTVDGKYVRMLTDEVEETWVNVKDIKSFSNGYIQVGNIQYGHIKETGQEILELLNKAYDMEKKQ